MHKSIVLDPEYAGGLRDLERSRYIYVACYIHRIRRSVSMSVCLPCAPGKNVGLFAGRSSARPDLAGLGIVRLKSISDILSLHRTRCD
ncbi:MAG: TrmO family methyltransferase [Thermodesulfobacteriota bacterium]